MVQHTYVLLGASNLTISAPLLLENLRRNSDGAAEVRVAMGFGRSYGGWSRFLFRDLPGIIDCGLWADLPCSGIRENSAEPRTVAEVSRLPLRALVTDVGNDLVYGHSPECIAGWVDDCVRRLQALGGDVVLTLPPVESLTTLPGWRYSLLRTVFFPSCRTPLPEMRQLAGDLHARLTDVAASRGITAVGSPGEWYGFDPIHIRRRHRSAVWQSVLRAWNGSDGWQWSPRASRGLHRATRSAAPAVCRRRGRERTAVQPAIRTDAFRVGFF